jgi:hypothetical protein
MQMLAGSGRVPILLQRAAKSPRSVDPPDLSRGTTNPPGLIWDGGHVRRGGDNGFAKLSNLRPELSSGPPLGHPI